MTLKDLIEMAAMQTAAFHAYFHRVPPPHVLAVQDGGRLAVFWVPELGGPAKQELLALVRQGLVDIDAVAYVLIMEAWATEREAADAYAQSAETTMEHFPGRKEIVSYHGEDAVGGTMLALQPMIRQPADAEAFTLGALEFMPADTMGGNMVGLLPPRGAKH